MQSLIGRFHTEELSSINVPRGEISQPTRRMRR